VSGLSRPAGAAWGVLILALAAVAGAVVTAQADQPGAQTMQTVVPDQGSPTLTPTPPATATPTVDDTATVTPTLGQTLTLAPTPSQTLTVAPTPSQTATVAPTPSQTLTVAPTPSHTATAIFTPSKTSTNTPLPRNTPTDTPLSKRTASPTITPSATIIPSSTPTLTPTPGSHRIYLPVVSGPPVVVNGGFENGFTGWQIGEMLTPPANLSPGLSTAYAEQGSYSVLLGDTNYQADCNGNEPIGAVYVSQQIIVPQAASVTLGFSYRIFTQDDIASGDSFDVYVNQIVDDPAHHLYTDGNTNPAITGCQNPPTDIFHGWKMGAVDLTQFAGQSITLYFAEQNRLDGYDVTYVYLDNISVGTSPIQLLSHR
jgi:hypothetical protein